MIELNLEPLEEKQLRYKTNWKEQLARMDENNILRMLRRYKNKSLLRRRSVGHQLKH